MSLASGAARASASLTARQATSALPRLAASASSDSSDSDGPHTWPGLRWGLGGLLIALGLSAQAAVFCDRPADLNAAEQDRQLRLVAEVKRVLQQQDAAVALVSRSGTDLDRFDIRYSHAGLALRDSPQGAWSVRQLYYACDESRPRLFDQGLTGFLLSAGSVAPTRLSMVLLPAHPAQQLATAALDNRTALALLASRYSANAFTYSTRYQNCNQWVAEMMARAWYDPRADGTAAARPDSADGADTGGIASTASNASNADSVHAAQPSAVGDGTARAVAQRQLAALGYAPAPVRIPSHGLMFAAQFVPLIHLDDHPIDDLYALQMRVSTPAALEQFVPRLIPDASRVELCATSDRLVVRRGWQPLDAHCEPGPDDTVTAWRG